MFLMMWKLYTHLIWHHISLQYWNTEATRRIEADNQMGPASSMKPVLEVITNECPLKEVAISKMKMMFQPWIFRGQAE